IAHALLGDPSVLILDEPANGLDPEGIYWMRGLLRDFADRGGTVMLSSHLLREVEAVADHLVVIGQGRIAADDANDALLTGAGISHRAGDDATFAVDAPAETVGRLAAQAGVALLELRPADSGGLEELFLRLTTVGDATTEVV